MTEQFDSVESFVESINGLGQQVSRMDYTQELTDFKWIIAQQPAGMSANECDSNRSVWTPFLRSTVKRNGRNRILYKSRALRASLVNVSGPSEVSEVTPRGMVFHADASDTTYQQAAASCLPASPPIGTDEEMLDRFVNWVADATVEKLKLSTGAT